MFASARHGISLQTRHVKKYTSQFGLGFIQAYYIERHYSELCKNKVAISILCREKD